MAHAVRAVIFLAVLGLVSAEKACMQTDKWEASEKESPPCDRLMNRNSCVMNQRHHHQGSCGDHWDQASCEADSGKAHGTPYDSTKKRCMWLENFTDDAAKKAGCESFTGCEFDGSSCKETDKHKTEREEWSKGKGLGSCSARVDHGCLTLVERSGAGWCSDIKDETACLANDKGNEGELCSMGICSGTSTDGPCAELTWKHECTGRAGCTFKSQCCQWAKPPEDFESVCLNGPTGYEATITGLCEVKEDTSAAFGKCYKFDCPMTQTVKFPDNFFKNDVEADKKAMKENEDVKAAVKCMCQKCGKFEQFQEIPLIKGGGCSAAGVDETSDGRSPFLALGVLLVLGMASLM